MVRTLSVCLDTHVVVWLVGGHLEEISKEAQALIGHADLFVSPAVVLELQFLYEIGRVNAPATEAISALRNSVSLKVAEDPFESVVNAALSEDWTRDPFDRLIVAHARMLDIALLSRDRRIANAYAGTQW